MQQMQHQMQQQHMQQQHMQQQQMQPQPGQPLKPPLQSPPMAQQPGTPSRAAAAGPPRRAAAASPEAPDAVTSEIQSRIAELQRGLSATKAEPPPAEAGAAAASASAGGLDDAGDSGGAPGVDTGRGAVNAKGTGSEGAVLHVGNVPPSLCDISSLSGFFGRFGRILDIKIHRNQRYAFVEFSSRFEAVKALDSPDPVMGKPEIRLGWAAAGKGSGRGAGIIAGGRGAAGGRATSGAPGDRGRGASTSQTAEPSSPGASARAAKPAVATPHARPTPQKTAEPKAAVAREAQATQKSLQEQLAQQKALILKLEKGKDLPKLERKELMGQLKTLSAAVKATLAAQTAAAARAGGGKGSASPAELKRKAQAPATPGGAGTPSLPPNPPLSPAASPSEALMAAPPVALSGHPLLDNLVSLAATAHPVQRATGAGATAKPKQGGR